MPVTVVVITRDRRAELMHTVARLAALPEAPPVIVVDNGSTDGTPDAVRAAFPSVDVVALSGNLAAAGRTVGVRRAATPYVAFADDDSWWAPGALPEAERIFDAHPRLALVCGRILVGPAEYLDPVCAEMAASPLGRAPDLPGPSLLGFVACGAVVRRSAYLDAGGFQARFGVGGEESVLAWDLAATGWGLAYVDRVVAHHHPSPVRDAGARQRREMRNALWSVLLRRRRIAVARQLAGVLQRVPRDATARGALSEALRGLPGVLRDRRPVPPGIERQLRLLETSRVAVGGG